MDLDAIRSKWMTYSQGIHFRDEAEYRVCKEAYESAYLDGYLTGHNIGNVVGIANTAIDKAMKYD